jgi:hypothetical protein
MSGVRWSAKDDRYLRRWYGTKATEEIAAKVGRSASSVHQHAARIGLHQRRRTAAERDQLIGRIRTWNARGYSDAEIGAKLRLCRRTITFFRNVAGLPHNRLADRQRRRVAEQTRRQCRAAGVTNLAEVKSLVFRKHAKAAGWPEDLSPRAVAILQTLKANGPMTRRQLCEAMGMTWRGSRTTLKTKRNSYLAELQHRGLVVTLGRIVKGKGRGRSVQAYALPLW